MIETLIISLFFFILGIFATIFLQFYYERLRYWIYKISIKFCKPHKRHICELYHIVFNHDLLKQKEYRIINFYDQSMKEFSIVASDVLDKYFPKQKERNFNKYQDSKNDTQKDRTIIISNVQEPYWYWNEFIKVLNNQGVYVEQMNNLETECKNHPLNVNKIKEILNNLYDTFLEEIDLFPHQKTLIQSIDNSVYFKFRINIFPVELDTRGELTNLTGVGLNNSFLQRNKLYHLLFFEKLFGSNGVNNIVIHPYELDTKKNSTEKHNYLSTEHNFKGTNALIIGNKFVFNYDSEIKILNYQLNKEGIGFFGRIIKLDLRQLKSFNLKPFINEASNITTFYDDIFN